MAKGRRQELQFFCRLTFSVNVLFNPFITINGYGKCKRENSLLISPSFKITEKFKILSYSQLVGSMFLTQQKQIFELISQTVERHAAKV